MYCVIQGVKSLKYLSFFCFRESSLPARRRMLNDFYMLYDTDSLQRVRAYPRDVKW